jgi:hypothetical protein
MNLPVSFTHWAFSAYFIHFALIPRLLFAATNIALSRNSILFCSGGSGSLEESMGDP